MLDRILVVDDEPIVLKVLGEVLTSEGFQVAQAESGQTAVDMLDRDPFALVLCDIRMPGMNGFELLREVRRSHPGTDVVMMTGFGSIDGAVDAMSLGAADYLIKPLKPKEIVARIRAILERRKLEAEIHNLQSELRSRYDMKNIVADSPRMNAVVSALHRLAPSEEPVLVSGPVGSGREFICRAIHLASPRRDRPLESVRCESTSLPRFAEQVFGHKRPGGRARRGLLERLAEGTVYLHGVEELAPEVQEMLAACLRDQCIRRIGSETPIPLKARLLFSITGALGDLFEQGKLIEELSLLRSWVTLSVPPLRQRLEDLPALVETFAKRYAIERGQRLRVQPEAIQALAEHEFPGNVDQLFAALDHSATLSMDGKIGPENVERGVRQVSLETQNGPKAMAEHLGDRECQLVLRAVNRHPGRLDQAARELGVSRTTLWRRMRKYGIKLPTA